MLEKEIKVLDIDKEKVIKKLEELGAEMTFDGFIHDIYYDFLNWKDKKMEQNDRLFRIRRKWESYIYTIKRKRKKIEDWGEKWVKIADEWESSITNLDGFLKVIEKYWMRKTREKKKQRISFRLWDTEFDIDEYENIPTLLEIEAKDTKTLEYYIKILWLENHEQKDFGSRWLFEYYWIKYLEF